MDVNNILIKTDPLIIHCQLLEVDMMVYTYTDLYTDSVALCFNALLFLSTSKYQTYDTLLNKWCGRDDNDSKVATMREWRIGYEENLVQIPEHKIGKSALFSVAATKRKCKS